jgi:hypothetical protein
MAIENGNKAPITTSHRNQCETEVNFTLGLPKLAVLGVPTPKVLWFIDLLLLKVDITSLNHTTNNQQTILILTKKGLSISHFMILQEPDFPM